MTGRWQSKHPTTKTGRARTAPSKRAALAAASTAAAATAAAATAIINVFVSTNQILGN